MVRPRPLCISIALVALVLLGCGGRETPIATVGGPDMGAPFSPEGKETSLVITLTDFGFAPCVSRLEWSGIPPVVRRDPVADVEELRRVLLERADSNRLPDAPHPAGHDVLVRADAGLAWWRVAEVLAACGDTDIRLHHVWLAGRRSGEAALRCHLPAWVGTLSVNGVMRPARKPPERRATMYLTTDRGRSGFEDVERLRAWCARLREECGRAWVVLDLRIVSEVSCGGVLRAMNEARRFGFSVSVATGAPASDGASIGNRTCYYHVGPTVPEPAASARPLEPGVRLASGPERPDVIEPPGSPRWPMEDPAHRFERKRRRRTGLPSPAREAVSASLGWLERQGGEDGSWGTTDGGAPGPEVATSLALTALLAGGRVGGQTVRAGLAALRGTEGGGCDGLVLALRALTLVENAGVHASSGADAEAAAALLDLALAQTPFRGLRAAGEAPGDDPEATTWAAVAISVARAHGFEWDEASVRGIRLWRDGSSNGISRARRAGLRLLLDSNSLDADLSVLKANLPTWNPDTRTADLLDWYVRALAVVSRGESTHAGTHREALERAILPRRIAEGAHAGAWDPVSPWSGRNGRIACTALMSMILGAPVH